MATGRVPTTANSPLTAKGDLFGYSTTQARVPVGSDGETLVADSSATTGLRWTATPAASNPILNSGYDIWQRGTSLSGTASAPYTADRWIQYSASANTTISRQTTSDTTNLPNIQYCARVQRTAGNTGTGSIQLVQPLETTNSIPFAGKTVTMSFYARRGANFSATSNLLTVQLNTSTGTDQNPYSAWAGDVGAIGSNATLTTTWQRFTYTATLNTNISQIFVLVKYDGSGTAGAADFFEITGWQIDIGNTALPYRRTSGTLAGEFLACCRYFQRIGNGADNANENFGAAQAVSTTAILGGLRYLTPMRVTPTFTISSAGHFATLGSGGNVITATALTFQQTTPRNTRYDLTVASGLVAGNAAIFLANSASATLDASAEL